MYLVRPSCGSGPGVLVLHSWWGLNEFFRRFCDRLADEGFVALAPDLHEGKTATTISEAQQLRDRSASRVADHGYGYVLRCPERPVYGEFLGIPGTPCRKRCLGIRGRCQETAAELGRCREDGHLPYIPGNGTLVLRARPSRDVPSGSGRPGMDENNGFSERKVVCRRFGDISDDHGVSCAWFQSPQKL